MRALAELKAAAFTCMKTCGYCGRENEDGAVHCSQCGTNEFRVALQGEALPRVHSPDVTCRQSVTAQLESDSNFFKQFIPRGESKVIFVFAVTCYTWMLASLMDALVSAVQFPPPTGNFTDMPMVRMTSAMLLAPIVESLLLVGGIEVVRVFRAPVWVQVTLPSLIIALLHCFSWPARGLIIAPMFVIHAGSYLHWRRTSKQDAFGIVVCMHSLHNLVPTIYLAESLR